MNVQRPFRSMPADSLLDHIGVEVGFELVAGQLFHVLADEQGGPVLVGQSSVGQSRKVPHERFKLPLPRLLLRLTEVGAIVGVNHATACSVLASYNKRRTPDRFSTHRARSHGELAADR